MDKKGIIAIVLAVAVMVGWQLYIGYKYPAPERPAEVGEDAVSSADVASPSPMATASPPPTVAPEPEPTPVVPESFEERIVTLNSEDAEGKPVNRYEFTNRSGGILVAELLRHRGENGENVLLNEFGDTPVGGVSTLPGGSKFQAWAIRDQTDRSITFEREIVSGINAVKTFSMPKVGEGQDPYTVNVQIDFTNTGSAPVTFQGYYFQLGAAAPLHKSDWETYTKFDWFTKGSHEGIDVNWFRASRLPLIGIETRPARTEMLEQHPDITWAGVKDQYFTILAIDPDGLGDRVWASSFLTEESTKAIRGSLGVGAFTVPPGGSVTNKFELYFGPKEYSRLKGLGNGVSEAMDFGIFKIVSIFLLKMMKGIHAVVRDYGVAILVLTLVIKSALWPLQNKATNSMKRMQALQPKMQELREKYKDDPQRMNTELMKMYKDYGINPFGGCLPMVVQIPIFFGFYRMLGTAAELRNEHFLWVKDLSQPDTVALIPGLGWPINVLPLLMAATMLWQQVLMPKSGDQMQQRVFKFVPLIFVVFCYNFASALALYWTAQNIFSVVQLYLTRNKELPALTKVTPSGGGSSSPKTKKKKR